MIVGTVAHHNCIVVCWLFRCAVASVVLRSWRQQICASISCLVISMLHLFFSFLTVQPKIWNAFDDKWRKKGDGLIKLNSKQKKKLFILVKNKNLLNPEISMCFKNPALCTYQNNGYAPRQEFWPLEWSPRWEKWRGKVERGGNLTFIRCPGVRCWLWLIINKMINK